MAHEHAVCMMLVDGAAGARDEKVLRRYAPRLEKLARRDDHRLCLAIAHRGWGVAHLLAGENAEAEERLSKARELFQALEARWQVGRTLYEMAELDLARSDSAAAFGHFGLALAAFEALGAAPDAERMKRALADIS